MKQLDADLFDKIDDVPIFHENKWDDDGEEFSFDASKLEKMVAINNSLVAKGEPPVIIVGHTDDTNNEKPAVGFMDHFTLGMRNGLKTIFARFLIYKDQLGELKKYPKRSLEVNPDLTIPAVALLGGNEPRLSLGVLYQNNKLAMKFSKGKFYATGVNKIGDEKMAVPEELKMAVLEVLSETDVFAFVKDMMEKGEIKVEEAEEKTEGEVGMMKKKNRCF